VLDPETIEPNFAQLGRRDEDPPVLLMVIPPFGPRWISRMEAMGAVPITDAFKQQIEDSDPQERREMGWHWAQQIERRAVDAGSSGVILMGLKYKTVVDEAATAWR